MERLILSSAAGANLARSKLADMVVLFSFRFTWGPLPSSDHFAAYFEARSGALRPGDHWSDWTPKWPAKSRGLGELPFAEFCARYDQIEFWFDPSPDDQLQLVCLLDHFRSHPELLPKLKLRLIGFELTVEDVESLAKSAPHVPLVDVGPEGLDTASRVWRAYCEPTPEACVDLAHCDLSALLMLRPVLLELLAELPSPKTGLGATEMRILDMLARGFAQTNSLFHLRSLRRTYVFREFELGWLLQGLALGPKPAVAGLNENLRTIDEKNLRDRHAAYLRSRLWLTDFGKAVPAGEEDFSRHIPIAGGVARSLPTIGCGGTALF